MAPFLLRIPIVLAFIVSVLTMSVQAAETTPSTLSPSQDETPILTLYGLEERRALSRADIESLPLYETTLKHFEGSQGSFAGVWLEDLMAAEGIAETATLRFIAHDDYTTFITPDDRQARDYLLATRLDGEPLTLEKLGPSLLMIPAEAEAVESGKASMMDWIWSIRNISIQ
ncbi:hypothetical protein ACU6TU_14275 [Halomonas sp. LS-001]